MKMVSIYDSKAEAWMAPLFFQAVGQALRSFGDAVNQSGTDFNRHPEDYTAFLLGDFSEQTGRLELLEAPVALATGVTMVRQTGLEVVK